MEYFLHYITDHWNFILADLLIFLGGLFAGGLLCTLQNARHFGNIYISPKHKNAEWNMARIKQGEKEYIYLNPTNYWQTIEAWFTYLWWDMTGRKSDYIMQNKRSRRVIIIILVSFLTFVALFELYNVFSIEHLNRDLIDVMIDEVKH